MRSARIFSVLAAAALSFASVAWGSPSKNVVPSGRPLAESRTVPAFRAVSVALPAEVVLRQGAAAPVALEADDNLLPDIETVVEDGTLKLRFRRSLNVTGKAHLRITVTAPAFDAIAITGSGNVTAERLKAGALALAITGSGDLRLAGLEADSVKASLSGSGDLRAAGRAAEFSAKISGSGDIDAAALETKRATISIAGSGDARVWATEALSASVAGSGDVRYRGTPAVTRSVAGSGSVKPLPPTT